MTAYWQDGAVTVYLGDCLDVLPTLPDASVDAVVTDPPAGIAFMGREWDGDRGGRDRWVAWLADRLAGAARVLKPGGHALVWALPRTSHWTATAIDDAGLTIYDCVTHIFGSGFPKHKNALKPASEHWWLARKPLSGTVAGNVLEHGTGALNIAGCRVGDGADRAPGGPTGKRVSADEGYMGRWADAENGRDRPSGGRWPTNVVFSHPPKVVDGEVVGDACAAGCVEGCPVAELDRQSGVTPSNARRSKGSAPGTGYADGWTARSQQCHDDSGSASRFFPVFRYEAKAAAVERPKLADGTAHQTVKPLALIRWLTRLVTPPGGVVLDPFAGSGTTGEAAVIEGFRALLIEKEAPHAELIKVRLSKPIGLALDLGEL
jgi:site-specific DNA-methyltransferase (adenine-specific)